MRSDVDRVEGLCGREDLLVGSRDDLGVCEQLLEERHAPVGDTDGLCLARSGDLLHELPCLLWAPVSVDGTRAILVEWDLLVAALLKRYRPVHEQQIDIVQAELLERFVQTGLGIPVVCAPDLGGDEELRSGNARCLDALADFRLVSVYPGCVFRPGSRGNVRQ